MQRLFVGIAAIGLIALTGLSSSALARESDPTSVVEGFNNAVADPEAGLQFLTDDVTIRIIPPPPGQSGVWTGKEEARGFLEFTKAQNVKRERVGAWQVEGNRVSGTVMVTNKDFTTWGVAPVEHTLKAVVENGEIKSWTSIMSPAERDTVRAARDAYQPGAMPGAGGGGSAGMSGAFLLLPLGGLVVALGLALRLARQRIL